MKKRAISLLLVFAMAVSLASVTALAAAPGLDNFTTVRAYSSNKFTDVKTGNWFYADVKRSYELNLIDGRSESAYVPYANLTLAEAVKLAACLHSIYYTGEVTLQNGNPWYRPYADYALEYGIISSDFSNYFANATRAQFAEIFGNALPNDALRKINNVPSGAIPDVSMSASYADEVYKLYRAGILTGNDDKGTFTPNANIDRSQMAAITARMADESLRKSFSLGDEKLTAEEVFEKCAPAVFYIVTYDRYGKPLKSGSGFFIESDGTAVTNQHVIDGAYSAEIHTNDGEEYKVSGIYDWDEDCDLALLKINGKNFPYLNMGDSSAINNGATIYAIGSPLGLENSITQGIISSKSRIIQGREYIQISASISHGSSGGALIDTSGDVIGVTTASIEDGQSLNLAVPINKVSTMTKGSLQPLSAVSDKVTSGVSLTASDTDVTVPAGFKQVVYIKVDGEDFYSVTCLSNNTAIANCAWDDWVDEHVAALIIHAYKQGATTITVNAIDEDRNVIDSETIKVTVN